MNPDANLLCLRLILRQKKEALAECVARGFDFQAFQHFCEKQLLSGYVYSSLSAARLGELFPKEFMERAKLSYMNQWAVNERLAMEIQKISDLFSGAGIGVIFLKGPFLAERFYDHVACRVTRDVDILVKAEDINRADETLLRDGFHRRSNLALGKESTIRFTHHFEYSKPGVKVELHWVLARHFSFRIDYGKLWTEKKTFRFREKTYRVLAEDEELVMQFLSIFTDIPLGTLALKQFVDVYHIIKKLKDDEAEWNRFFEDRKKEGLLLISVNVLDLVLETLGAAGDFPALSGILRLHDSLIRLKNPEAKKELLARPKSLRGRIWAFSLCEGGVLKSFAWWAVSLPFRLSAYPGWAAPFFPAPKKAGAK